MSEPLSPQKIEANRQNAQKSTGPKTPEGKAASRLNAIKYGIYSRDIVIQGRCLRENQSEFGALHDRLREDLQPVGLLEEMLVDQIITTHWRLRRALKAESAEIALSVDVGCDARSRQKFQPGLDDSDPISRMQQTADGNRCLQRFFQGLREEVELMGEISDDSVKTFADEYGGAKTMLANDIQAICDMLRDNPDKVSPSELKQDALSDLDWHIRNFARAGLACKKREKITETCHQAAQALPTPAILNKCSRYIAPLERQLFLAMNQLERLQQRRLAQKRPSPCLNRSAPPTVAPSEIALPSPAAFLQNEPTVKMNET